MSKNPTVPALGAADGNSLQDAESRFSSCAKVGLFKHAIGTEFGGLGDSFHDLFAAHAELGLRTHDTGLLLAINAHLWGAVFPLLKFGTEQQKKTLLAPLQDGRMIGGHAITEPQAGSNVQGIETHFHTTRDGYILNGIKRYITNTPLAGMLVVYAKENDVAGPVSAFIVQAGDKGAHFHHGPTVKGCATATMGDVELTNCLVPKQHLLGKLGAGGTMIQLALELERAFIFAGVTGIMQWQLQEVIRYVRSRPAAGGLLSEMQAVSHKIAEMKLRLESCRLWVKQCADLCDSSNRITLASAQTKLYASEAFLQNSLDAAHIMGAAGLEHELPILVQDAMAGRLLSGSSEIQKNIIAAMLGLSKGI
ncbi:MAG: acyl-CoA dehydrogenase family protein [Candidatus Thiodiazotropha sp. (ex Lucinoma kastoroae)]|nr:acyl-CoA dehydrogenase family protein [Candidatus Thiodiazotropha sp. (ex Rostrolucina anterorostrata)]MCU7849887.1 acyl-CoA dehydrogenase family protein [Candidatus Thiodiazotropha sp. (ex Lucinoma kastoroae)]MCU7862120.1 acyl-CoA dehydrogenase family protein [Candidatus Thiodiazotropha sp. (ex Lucinoma kastoroae)]